MATPPGETSLARIFRDADLDLRFFFEHRGNNKAWCSNQANKRLDRWGEWERLEVLKKKEENDEVLRRNKGEDERRRSRSRRSRLRQISSEPRNVP